MLLWVPALGTQALPQQRGATGRASLPASAAEPRECMLGFLNFFFPKKKMNCAIIILMDVTRSPCTDT